MRLSEVQLLAQVIATLGNGLGSPLRNGTLDHLVTQRPRTRKGSGSARPGAVIASDFGNDFLQSADPPSIPYRIGSCVNL